MKIEKISKKQSEIIKFAFSSLDTIIADGAVRSGKTIAMTLSFVIWAMTNFDKTNFAICGKTVGSAERNILKPFMQLEDLMYKLSYRIASRCLTIRCGDKENYIYFFGGKDESSSTLIQGITIAGVLFDEVALMPRSFVEQAMARTLSYKDAKTWFNCNPASPNHWFYKEWIISDKKNVKHLHFVMTDNPTMGEEQLAKAETKFQGIFYDRYIRGLWVTAEGAIYKIFTEHKSDYIISKEQAKKESFKHLLIGLDFGGNKSQHSITLTGITADYRLFTLKSNNMTATNTTTDDLFKFVHNFVIKSILEWGEIEGIYADSAEQVYINSLRNMIKVPIYNSIKSTIIDRIRTDLALMSAKRRFIVEGECQPLVEFYQNAVWDDKSSDDKRLDDGSYSVDAGDSNEYSWSYYSYELSQGLEIY